MSHLIAGNDPNNQVREVSVDSNGKIDTNLNTLNKTLESEPVSQGFGLGIRQHDAVMLAYGYSRFTRHEVTIPVGDFLVLRLDINDVHLHHAEDRLIITSASSIRLKLYVATGNEDLFPATPTQMPVFNQIGVVKETVGVDVFGEISYYPIQQTDPFTSLTPGENVPLYTPSSGVPNQPRPDQFESVRGRHYIPNETYALVIENIGNLDTNLYYQYDWHEY